MVKNEFDNWDMKTYMAAKLYEQAKLTLAQAAEMSEYSISDFMNLLFKYNVSILNSPASDLELDVENAEKSMVAPKKPQNRIAIPIFNYEKFKNSFLYVLEKTAGKTNINEQMLFNLLYFCDFNYYEIYDTQLTSIQYKKILNNPIPENIDKIIQQIINEEAIIRIKTKANKSKLNLTRLIPLQKADLQILKASEKEIIDNVIDQMSNWSITAIESYTQKDMPLIATKENDIINYEFAFYREAPYSVRFYNEEI